MAQQVAYWTLPGGVYEALSHAYSSRTQRLTAEERRILESNRSYRGRHVGQRCFILATGPSVREQDLTPLASEICVGASDFYRHEEYERINPAYHVLAPLHEPFTDDDGIRRATELVERASPGQIVFCGLADRGFIERANVFAAHEAVHYLKFMGMKEKAAALDLARPLPLLSSATVMGLWVAVWMGFSKIYLLGCDHNVIWQWDGSPVNVVQHFYEGAPSIGYAPFDIDRSLAAHLSVRAQYRWTKQIADLAGIEIFNASPGSYIDIFPRVEYESIISGPRPQR